MLRGHAATACEHLRYGDMDPDGNGVDNTQTIAGVTIVSRPILVGRTGDNQWTAESRPDGAGRHVAFCENTVDGQPVYVAAYDIPFTLRVVQK